MVDHGNPLVNVQRKATSSRPWRVGTRPPPLFDRHRVQQNEITNDGCKSFPVLEVPAKGTTEVVDLQIEQNEGDISLLDLIAPLRGGIYFDNSFEVGGTVTLDRGGIENVLLAILLKGEFEDPNSMSGEGYQRFVGRVSTTEIDCTVTFKVSGIRDQDE